METDKTCPSCGKPIGPDAPQGLCPACLMKVGAGSYVSAAIPRIGSRGDTITDSGLASLTNLKDLEELELQHCAITDRGLEHLFALAKLRTIYLGKTSTTDEGWKTLKMAIPDLKVDH
jgi:hypothetical protein